MFSGVKRCEKNDAILHFCFLQVVGVEISIGITSTCKNKIQTLFFVLKEGSELAKKASIVFFTPCLL